MEIKYSKSAPLRTSPCLAWLIEYLPAGRRDILLTSPEMTVEEVVKMIKIHTKDHFTVANLTVGAYMLLSKQGQKFAKRSLDDGFYNVYLSDARKVDDEGMVQL